MSVKGGKGGYSPCFQHEAIASGYLVLCFCNFLVSVATETKSCNSGCSQCCNDLCTRADLISHMGDNAASGKLGFRV